MPINLILKMKDMKTKIILCFVMLIFGISSLFSQAHTIREKNPNDDKFVGVWVYDSSSLTFTLSLNKYFYSVEKMKMELLTGAWSVRNKQTGKEINHEHILCTTKDNPNKLEGLIRTEDGATVYYFTLEMKDTAAGNKLFWVLTRTKKNSPDANRETHSPPAECVLTKVIIAPPPPDPFDPNPPGHQIY